MAIVASSHQSAQSSAYNVRTRQGRGLYHLKRAFVRWSNYGETKRSLFLRKSLKKAIKTIIEAVETPAEWLDLYALHRALLREKGITPRLENVVFDEACIVSKGAVKKIEKYLKKERGIPRHDLQSMLTAIVLVLRYRLPWKAIPHELGHYKTIYGFYHRYSASGQWLAIMHILMKACRMLDTSTISIDSTCCKCEREASSLYTKDKERLIGHTRGGFNSKIHVVCDKNGVPFHIEITPGNRSDVKVGYQILEKLKDLKIKGQLLADKGYDSKRFRQRARELGFNPYVPHRKFTKAKKVARQRRRLLNLLQKHAGNDNKADLEKDFQSFTKEEILAMTFHLVNGKGAEKSYSRKKALTTEEDKVITDVPYDPELNEANAAVYDGRNVVERCIGCIKNVKNISLRKDRAAHIYRSSVAFGLIFTFFLS